MVLTYLGGCCEAELINFLESALVQLLWQVGEEKKKRERIQISSNECHNNPTSVNLEKMFALILILTAWKLNPQRGSVDIQGEKLILRPFLRIFLSFFLFPGTNLCWKRRWVDSGANLQRLKTANRLKVNWRSVTWFQPLGDVSEVEDVTNWQLWLI